MLKLLQLRITQKLENPAAVHSTAETIERIQCAEGAVCSLAKLGLSQYGIGVHVPHVGLSKRWTDSQAQDGQYLLYLSGVFHAQSLNDYWMSKNSCPSSSVRTNAECTIFTKVQVQVFKHFVIRHTSARKMFLLQP